MHILSLELLSNAIKSDTALQLEVNWNIGLTYHVL